MSLALMSALKIQFHKTDTANKESILKFYEI